MTYNLINISPSPLFFSLLSADNYLCYSMIPLVWWVLVNHYLIKWVLLNQRIRHYGMSNLVLNRKELSLVLKLDNEEREWANAHELLFTLHYYQLLFSGLSYNTCVQWVASSVHFHSQHQLYTLDSMFVQVIMASSICHSLH